MATRKPLLALLLLASLCASGLFVPGPAAGGDADDPDMEDSAGDSVSQREARDLVAGWVSGETETTIDFTLLMSALEPVTPYADWQNLPVVFYEFFFDVVTPQGTLSFELRATVPMHGPFAALTTYDLYLVTYGAGGSIANESVQGSPTGRYLFNESIVGFTVDKALIGEPARGDILEGIWARIRSASQRTAGDAITEDTMLSHLTPGKPYTFSGGVTFYSITLTATGTSANATAEDPARFTITIHSDSEKGVDVSIRNSSSMPSNWTITTDKTLYRLEPGTDATAFVTITPGGNTTNVTRRITVQGTFRDDQNETKSSANTVTLSVFVPPPTGGGGGGGGGCIGAACPPITDPTAILPFALAGVAALGAAVFVFGFFLPSRRRVKAQASLARIQQLRAAKGGRSGVAPIRPGPAARPGMATPGAPPMPGAMRPAPRPGMPPRAGGPPGARPSRPIPKRR